MKKTKLYSILFDKCPRCYQGDFFITKNPYDLKNFTRVHERCPVCGEDFTREIGFYYGAMYVSYGLTITLGVGIFILTWLILDLGETVFLTTFTIAALLLWTWIFRKARIIWLNLFVHRGRTKKKK